VHIANLSGHSSLLVEDEPLLVIDMAMALEEAGAVVFSALTPDRAKQLVETHTLSAAVLNFTLKDSDAEDVCSRLNQRDPTQRSR